jgi:hypothetical protein
VDPSVPCTSAVSVTRRTEVTSHLHESSHCVGTRRPAALSQKQLQHLMRSSEHRKFSNFESRMIAEVKLYWVIYQMTSASPTGISRTNHELLEWQNENAALFGNSIPTLPNKQTLIPISTIRPTTIAISSIGITFRSSSSRLRISQNNGIADRLSHSKRRCAILHGHHQYLPRHSR